MITISNKHLLVTFLLLLSSGLFAQQKTLKGKITNAENGEAMSYVPVYVVFPDGNIKSTNTDFEGFYTLDVETQPDSLVAKFPDFTNRSLFIRDLIKDDYNIALTAKPKKKSAEEARTKSIEGVIIRKKAKKKYENPAFAILENFVARKPQNNPEKFSSYSYENYSRMEISMSNFGEKLEKRKVFKDIKAIAEAAKEVSGEDGKPVIPVFVSENLSDVYYQKDPQKSSEIIKKSRVEGIGIEDGTMFSQLVSSTFIKYNFYNNYIRILGKDFLSPVNDNFKMLYDYELVDRNLEIDGDHYYLLKFMPKRASDLAFVGTVIISHGSYALFRMDAKVTENANLNFINNMKIQQEMTKLPEDDNWLPGKTRVFVETARPGKQSLSVFIKYYSSTKNIEFNKPIDQKILEKQITVLKNSENNDEGYWNKNRHDSLTVAEKKMYGMISEVKNLPSVRSYLDIIDLLLNGYYKVGKVGLGPFLYTLGYNNHEGLRTRIGFKTNKDFSDKWILGGYVSYGFLDEKFKYGATVDYIFKRDPWIQGGVGYAHDLGQVAFQYEDFSLRRNNMFDSFTKNGKMKLRRPFQQDIYTAYLQADLASSLTEKVTFKHYNFDPFFPFGYQENIGDGFMDRFKTSEIIAETMWRPGRRLIESNSNRQISVKDNVYNPFITFRYTRGLKGVFGSDFNYDKFHLNIQQTVPMGILGRGEYSLTGGLIPTKLPYPLLENHLGNEFIFYNRYAFNMMHFFEFTSSKYASLQYTQNLEGLITNSLPLIRKWNWRNHITFNYLIGTLDPSFMDQSYNQTPLFRSLNGKPYMEFGYGFSNIFRFLRIDFVHRLTHLETHHERKPSTFSVKISAQIRL